MQKMVIKRSFEVQITKLLPFQSLLRQESFTPFCPEKLQLSFEPMLSHAERGGSSSRAKSSLSGPKSWIKGLGCGRALILHSPRRLQCMRRFQASEGEFTLGRHRAARLNHLPFIPLVNWKMEASTTLRYGEERCIDLTIRPASRWTAKISVAN